ncbi:MAG: hypothetical protein IPL27_20680 [Lewinellaceae bacterium]|nr:hypothetical protein [Lewinellaceae bacterium]
MERYESAGYHPFMGGSAHGLAHYASPIRIRAVLAKMEPDFAEKRGDKWWQGKALNVIGTTYNLKGDYAAAPAGYLESARRP